MLLLLLLLHLHHLHHLHLLFLLLLLLLLHLLHLTPSTVSERTLTTKHKVRVLSRTPSTAASYSAQHRTVIKLDKKENHTETKAALPQDDCKLLLMCVCPRLTIRGIICWSMRSRPSTSQLSLLHTSSSVTLPRPQTNCPSR